MPHSTYTAVVAWQRDAAEAFVDNRYHRRHEWRFDGGAVVPGSSAVSSVPLPWSDPAAVDPEEAFTAALSSCHMLWFLHLAAKAGWRVDDYRDDALGEMGRDDRGLMVMTRVTLRPAVTYGGERHPDGQNRKRCTRPRTTPATSRTRCAPRSAASRVRP